MNKILLRPCLLVVVVLVAADAAPAPPADSTVLLHEKGQFGPGTAVPNSDLLG